MPSPSAICSDPFTIPDNWTTDLATIIGTNPAKPLHFDSRSGWEAMYPTLYRKIGTNVYAVFVHCHASPNLFRHYPDHYRLHAYVAYNNIARPNHGWYTLDQRHITSLDQIDPARLELVRIAVRKGFAAML